MVKERSNAPRDHAGRFARLASPRNGIDRVIRLLAPNDRPETIRALFDGRASHHTIRDWRRGKAPAPQWALDLLGAKLSAPLASLQKEKAGPGIKAGFGNLNAWRAARNSER